MTLRIEPVITGGDRYETVRYPADEIRLRVAGSGAIQVAEYLSEDREGSPPHRHEWDEVEYVIEGQVEFWLRGSWIPAGPGAVQILPAGEPHSVRVPSGRARVLMVTIGAPYDGFAREIAALQSRDPPASLAEIVAAAERHGVRLAGS